MTVTFQLQIDPMNKEKSFSTDDLNKMLDCLGQFKRNLDSFNEFIRFDMYVNNEVYYKVDNR